MNDHEGIEQRESLFQEFFDVRLLSKGSSSWIDVNRAVLASVTMFPWWEDQVKGKGTNWGMKP